MEIVKINQFFSQNLANLYMFYFWRERPNIEDYFELEVRNLILPNYGSVSITLEKFKWDAVEVTAKHTGTTLTAILDSTISKLPSDFEMSRLSDVFSHGIGQLIHEKAQFISLNVFHPINNNLLRNEPINNAPLTSLSLQAFKSAETAKKYIVKALPNYKADYFDFLFINHMKPFQDSNKKCAARAKRIKLEPVI